MKTQISILLAALALPAIGYFAHAATITWTNTSGGSWSVVNNRTPHPVPTNTDDGLISNAGIYTVTLDVSGVITNLTLGAGDAAGGVQMFASNTDSYCTSIAGA